MVYLLIVSAFPPITFLRVFPGFIARPFRGVGVGLEERVFDSWPSSGTGFSPNFPYFCIFGSSGWASVIVQSWKAGKYHRNRQLVRFRFVWMAFFTWHNHEMRRARSPAPSDAIATLEIIKLLLSYIWAQESE